MIPNLEDLPNEILLFMFDYLPIIDLLCTFYCLNHRFSRLTQTIKNLHIDFSYRPLSKAQFIYISNQLHSLNIKSIQISNLYYVDAIPNLISNNLSAQLNYLRSLILIDIDRHTMMKLVRNYPELKSLSIESSLWRSMPHHCLPYFSKLRYCRLPTLGFLNGCHSSIINLTLDNCTIDDLMQLNSLVPNLRSLTLKLNNSINTSSIVNFPIHLISLKLILRSVLFNEFERLIMMVNHIKTLTVTFSNTEYEVHCFDHYLFGDKWFSISKYADNIQFNIIINQSFETYSIPNLLSNFNWFPRKISCQTIDDTNGYHLYSLPFIDEIYTLNTVNYEQNIINRNDFDHVDHLHITIPKEHIQGSFNNSFFSMWRNLKKLTLIVPSMVDDNMTYFIDKFMINMRLQIVELRFTSTTKYCHNFFDKLIYYLPSGVHTLILNTISTGFLSDLLDHNDQLLSNIKRLICSVKNQDQFNGLFLLLMDSFFQKSLIFLKISLENPSKSSNLLSGWLLQTNYLKKARVKYSDRQCTLWF